MDNSDHTLSIVRPSLTKHIFDFSSETAEQNSTNFTGSKISMFSTKFVFFGPIGKNKMAAKASDWLTHFRLLLWNRWRELKETWQKDIFSNSPLKLLNRIQQTLQEARYQCSQQSLCFSGRSEKTKWPPRPLIGWHIFDFSFETAKGNSRKLDRKTYFQILLWNRWTEFSKLYRKQDLNILY